MLFIVSFATAANTPSRLEVITKLSGSGMAVVSCVQSSGESGGDPIQGKSRTRRTRAKECEECEECEECDLSSGSILN